MRWFLVLSLRFAVVIKSENVFLGVGPPHGSSFGRLREVFSFAWVCFFALSACFRGNYRGWPR